MLKQDFCALYPAPKGAGFTALFDNNDVSFDQMLEAVTSNNLQLVKCLYQKGFDLNKRSFCGDSILHIAAMNKDLYAILKYLTLNSLDCYVKNKKNQTPLHISCGAGNFLGSYLLAYNGGNINIEDYQGNTPISISVINGNSQTCLMLLDHEDVKTDVKNLNGDNLLHLIARAYCINSGDCKHIVQMLLANRIPTDEHNKQKQTPYQLALDLANKNFLTAYEEYIETHHRS